MPTNTIYIGNQCRKNNTPKVTGNYVDLNGETFYKISHYDQMKDFFMSVVSDSNHWIFISSLGGLSAGRVNSESALFPYYSDDKISDGSQYTGSRTLALVTQDGRTSLWEPFSQNYSGIYQLTRNLYKNVCGDKLIFEEINHDLSLTFKYSWRTSDKFGFVKTSSMTNNASESVSVNILDGIENIIPYGVESATQNALSCLVDAYKKNELDVESGLGLYSMSSILIDRAEPSEALSTTTVWSEGLPGSKKLLSSIQLDQFRRGMDLEQEIDVRGRRGAYFVNDSINLLSLEHKSWSIIAEVNQGPAKVRNLMAYLNKSEAIGTDIEEDITLGSENLARIVGISDGLQVTEDRLSANHHFSNVLFNVMRGGLFMDNYTIQRDDLIDFFKVINSSLFERHQSWLESLDETFHYSDLIKLGATKNDTALQRLCYEYLPLSFSRRHGDPSRPWNLFDIQVKRQDGSQILSFEGNWRDIFQNWEALCLSIPNFVESMICKFVNASTADGYNPYRITKSGIDWEKPEPEDPWANIGYWGDHQIIYLLKFLELSKRHHPGTLREFLTADLFCYANVPYRIKPYEQLLQDPHDTIIFDEHADLLIEQRVDKIGADGRLILDKNGDVYQVNLTEKLLAVMLSKLSNFIPGAGIWMNTQRPEWNDANNALVGFGVSMVTLYYLRRYQQYLLDFLSDVDFKTVAISEEIVKLFGAINSTLQDHQHLLDGQFSDEDRKKVVDHLGQASSEYREAIYSDSFTGRRRDIETSDLIEFCRISISHIDHTIEANRREDGLYHAYNLMTTDDQCVTVTHLYEMLEGQVAVLSSGYLDPKQALEVLKSLKKSNLFTESQNSYLLYPDRELARYLDKNVIPKKFIEKSELLTTLKKSGDQSLIEVDLAGNCFFNGSFNNVDGAKSALKNLSDNGYKQLVKKDQSLVEEMFEDIFNHKQFTGRSGGMYAYEGLGSIYWHMVSKLLLATLENFQKAVAEDVDPAVIGRLADCYFNIRAGIGFNKDPQNYGAFPTDPYSHTPGFDGAKQPGMTGQVKEEVVTRLLELGVIVENGCIRFDPFILRKSEFLAKEDTLHYFDPSGTRQMIPLSEGQLAFTYCQVPVVYSLADKVSIRLTFSNGACKDILGSTIESVISAQIFSKEGAVVKIEVSLKPGLD